MDTTKLLLLLLVVVILYTTNTVVYGAQCAQSEESMCVFVCNGTRFNLTEVFQYPLSISDDTRGYNYMWNPCDYQSCDDNIEPGKDCALCQKADRYYNCGHLERAVFLMQQYDPFMWKIQYLWGTDWRMAEFTFLVDKNRDTPTITFTGEDPYLQYNFFVTGKCIGQPYCQFGMPDPFKTDQYKGGRLKPSPTNDL